MGILDELKPKNNRLEELKEWLAARPKKEQTEWAEAFTNLERYSNGAIAKLLNSKGFPADDNLVYRYRKLEARRGIK